MFQIAAVRTVQRHAGKIHHFKPRRSRSAAAYGDQTFPLTICRSMRWSVCRSVCWCVDLSSALWKNGGSDPGIIGRTGPGMTQIVEFGDRSAGRGTCGANLGCAIVTNGGFTA